MIEALVSDLIAIIRKTADDPAPLLVARLEGEPVWQFSATNARPDSLVAELGELARRARLYGATDEELALSLGVFFTTSRARAVAP